MNVKRRSGFLLGGAIVFLLLMGLFAGETVLAAEKKVAKVALGDTHSAAIDTEGGLWMWGSNEHGALGNGEKGEYLCEGTPIKIMDDISSVSLSFGSSGDAHSGAVTRDGSLYMWGSNNFGQLGDGTTAECLKPKRIMSGVSQVVAGHRKTAVIKTDGSLWVWGYNGNGDLGTGDGQDHATPVKLLDDVVQVDFGGSHGAALKSDGSLWMWGSNNGGALGNSTAQGSAPWKLMDGVKQISLGHKHSGALKTDGSLYMWGDNGDGQIGDNRAERPVVKEPKKIMDGVAQFSLGQWASGIVKTDGSLWMCGYNTYISFSKDVPTKIADGATFVELGDTHNAMLKSDGSLWTWGAGWRGQLGDGVVKLSGHPVETPTKISIGVPPNTNNSGNTNNSNNSSSNNGTTSAGTGASKAVPGKSSTYTDQKITYKVTKSDAKNGTVALTKYDKKKTSVVIPATVNINGYTFKVTQISGKAFYKNKKLKKVTIGKNITSIGAKAFQGCTSLKSIQIKSTSLKKVGGKALSGIHKKATIKVPSKKLKAYKKLFKKKGQASTVKIKK